MNRNFKLLLLIGVIVITALLNACHNKSGEDIVNMDTEEASSSGIINEYPEILITRDQFEASGMKLGNPEIMTFNEVVKAGGYIVPTPAGKAMISSIIPGRVIKVNISPGDYLSKGEFLFGIESNEIIQLQKEYAEAYSRLNLIKGNFERQKILAAENISAEKEMRLAESEYLGLVARMEGLRAQLKLINIDPANVEKGDITPVVSIFSPISGYITRADVVSGQFIEPNEPVIEIIDINSLQLQLNLFKQDIKNLEPGQKVNFYDPDHPESIFSATLNKIGKTIDQETKTVKCYAEIKPGSRAGFVNNSFVETEIITSSKEAFALSETAITEEAGKYFVYLKIREDENGIVFQRTAINIGLVQKDKTEILNAGLKDVLVMGAGNLSEAE